MSDDLVFLALYDAQADRLLTGDRTGPLPAASTVEEGAYVVVKTAGRGCGAAPAVLLAANDWLVNAGDRWLHVPVRK